VLVSLAPDFSHATVPAAADSHRKMGQGQVPWGQESADRVPALEKLLFRPDISRVVSMVSAG
jgi:hypothetical protein